MPLNACELEIDLFCNGMRLDAGMALDGIRGVSRTRAGLGSGLDVALPAPPMIKSEIWVNVPIVEQFAKRSPYRLTSVVEMQTETDLHQHAIIDDRSGTVYPVRLPPEPEWYSRWTAHDVPMNRVGVMQGTYLAIYVNPVCAFWSYSPRMNCRFCTTGQNVGTSESAVKSLPDVIETCRAAKDESGVTFVHLNGGFQGTRGIEFVLPYVEAIKRDVGLLVGVQLSPEKDFTRYKALVDAGVDHLSFCVEFLDPEWFARMCPGKARVHGQQLYFDAMAYCAGLLPHGAVSGEVIAGLEPIDHTLRAIDRIVNLGAFPTVCIFRPTVGSDLESWPPPRFEDMHRVMAHVYDACRIHWLPIGAAPNIEVSLVVNPDDAALLAEHSASFFLYEAYRRVARTVTRPLFSNRMRPRPMPRRRVHSARSSSAQRVVDEPDHRGDPGDERDEHEYARNHD
jgi:hypothetical protein